MVLLASTALSLAAALPASAQDATWLANPGSGDFNTGANWDSGSVPTGFFTGTAFFGFSNTTALSFSTDKILGGWTFNAGASAYTFTNNHVLDFTGAGIAIDGGSANITNNGLIFFTNNSTAGSAAITNNVYLEFSNTGTAGSASITNSGALYFYGTSTAGSAAITNNGNLFFRDTSTAGSAAITNNNNLFFRDTSTAGSATITNTGGLSFSDTSTAGSAAITNTGTLNFFTSSTAGSATITNSGALNFYSTSTAGSAAITNNNNLFFRDTSTAGSATITNSGALKFYSTSTAGGAAITNNGGGASVDFSLTNGPLGDKKLSAGLIAGSGFWRLGANELTVGSNNRSTEVSGVVSGVGGSLVKTGNGTLTLSGANTYTGATIVDAGTLAVNGSIASSSLVFVNPGATLGGTGTVAATFLDNGATLSPGTPTSIGTLTVNTALLFCNCSAYAVKISATDADKTVVNGQAALAGAVHVTATKRVARTTTYTILTAAAIDPLAPTFDSVTLTNSLARNARLSYVGNDVLLTVDLGLLSPMLPDFATANQTKVAGAIDNALLGGANLPASFNTLFDLSGAQLTNALDQLSGQAAGGAAQAGTQMTTAFLTLLLNPFGGAPAGGSGGALGYARGFGAGETTLAPEAAAAYAAVTPKDKRVSAPFNRRWSFWGGGFGGANWTGGDAATGSADTRSRAYGFAAGADYRATADLLVGFALAGGGTSWSLAQGLGGGRADVFQIGAYASRTFGAAYVSAALTYAWHDVSTDRTVAVAGTDKLDAGFNAHSVGGRIEGGYRFATSWMGVTPYAALQVQNFRTPGYSETAASGSNTFALTYDARSTTSTRLELGAWFDNTIALDRGNVLALRSRAAWAHDHSSNPGLGAAFQTLPGSNFTVNGAQAPANSLLMSLGAELRLANGWSIGGRFDGEFASGSQTYAGTGTIRYTW